MLVGVWIRRFGDAAVANQCVGRELEAAGRGDQARAPIPETIAIHEGWHGGDGDEGVGSNQGPRAAIMHIQIQNHRRGLGELVPQFIADSYQHCDHSLAVWSAPGSSAKTAREFPAGPRSQPLRRAAAPAPAAALPANRRASMW